MRAVRRTLWAEGLFAAAVFMSSILAGGCGNINGKPTGEYLDLALAGMEGSDGVTFEGATALLQGTEGTPYVSLYYGGTVKEHDKVTLYTLLPDGSAAGAAATAGELKKLERTSASTPAYYSQLEKIKGQWQPLSGSVEDDNPLPRLNPLSQLEELQSLDKTVTEESGAGRGTRILRIELSPEEAHEQLARQLNQEMSALRTGSGLEKTGQHAAKPVLAQKLEAFWEKQNAELQRRLESAQVKTVYHVNVDVRRNLPKRLSCTRTVSYPDNTGRAGKETYVTEVNFYGYQ